MIKRFIILFFALVLIDQAIKVIVVKFFFDPHIHINIIDGVLTFCPMQNTHRGWIPSMFDYTMPPYMAVLISIIVALIMVAIYRLTTFLAFGWNKYKNLPVIILTISLAAVFCKLIDDIFWGGSIDYIRLFNWFTFDLKDTYSKFVIGFIWFYLIIFFMRYYKLSKEERKEYDKKVLSWLKSDLPFKPK